MTATWRYAVWFDTRSTSRRFESGNTADFNVRSFCQCPCNQKTNGELWHSETISKFFFWTDFSNYSSFGVMWPSKSRCYKVVQQPLTWLICFYCSIKLSDVIGMNWIRAILPVCNDWIKGWSQQRRKSWDMKWSLRLVLLGASVKSNL